MSKFDPLKKHLTAVRTAEQRMTFREIENLLGFSLPPSARKHRPWWSNNPDNSAITKAWLEAGFKTEQVDMGGETLVFRRVGPPHVSNDINESQTRLPDTTPSRSPIGGLKGTVRVAPGVDLTQPTGERWNAEDGRII